MRNAIVATGQISLKPLASCLCIFRYLTVRFLLTNTIGSLVQYLCDTSTAPLLPSPFPLQINRVQDSHSFNKEAMPFFLTLSIWWHRAISQAFTFLLSNFNVSRSALKRPNQLLVFLLLESFFIFSLFTNPDSDIQYDRNIFSSQANNFHNPSQPSPNRQFSE